MKVADRFRISLIVALFAVLQVPAASAEQLRYMDEAGNIRFVNRMSQVPQEYRGQIVPPTPTPVLDNRQKMALKAREQQEQNRRRQQERQRQLEDQRRRELAERQRLNYERQRLSGSGLDRVHRGQ